MSFSTKKFSLAHIAAIAIIVSAITLVATLSFRESKESETQQPFAITCNYNTKRIEGYKFIKPLLFVDEDCESEALMDIKGIINGIIEKHKDLGELNSASVFIRSKSGWMTINGGEKYKPGSLLKIPMMISVLKMSETNPGLLNERLTLDTQININRTVMIPFRQIEVGHTYTVRELLNRLIRYSDNNAAYLFEKKMVNPEFPKVFSNLGLNINIGGPNAYTAQELSQFMRMIYDASYLSKENSELAAEILSTCEFKDGIQRGLPAKIKSAHKFGEAGTELEKQLHETAIVYLDGKSYILTIMTKGKDLDKLKQVLAEISAATYNEMAIGDF